MIIGIDPGSDQSAIVRLSNGKVLSAHILPNDELLNTVRKHVEYGDSPIAVEMIASYGMAVGKEVFETCVLIGRIIEICHSFNVPVQRVYRKDVKIHLCGTMKAKDSNIAQALKDKYGQKGTAKNPGPLFGVVKDMFAALAVADYALAHPEFSPTTIK